ncbi:MAG: helix-turn-helix domain-containing protein [Pseudomonadota bacterium]
MSLQKLKAPSPSIPGECVPELLTTEDVCRILKVKESFIRDLRHQQRIPFIKIGHLVRYVPLAISAWLENGESAKTKPTNVIKGIESDPLKGGQDVDFSPQNRLQDGLRRPFSGRRR